MKRNIVNFREALLAFAAMASLGLAFWGCDDHSHGHPSTVRIVSPASGDTVSGPYVLLTVQTTNFGYGAPSPLAKIAGAAHDEGHIHIYVDGEPEVHAAAQFITVGDTATLVDSLAPGPHSLIVQGGSGTTHLPIPGMRDSSSFFVR